MNIHLEELPAHAELNILRRLAGKFAIPLFLVGGALRDYICRRNVSDFDFVVAAEGDTLPRAFSERIGGSFFWLDEKRGQCRILVKRGTDVLTFDFAPMRGTSIEEDLAARDFAVNALAIYLSRDNMPLIDPLCGMEDIYRKKIRSCTANAFIDDPLRMLRAFRLASTLGFTLEEATFSAIKKNAGLIVLVAPERIRDELFKILSFPKTAVSFRHMDSAGLLSQLLPTELRIEHGLAMMQQTEEICGSSIWYPEVAPLLSAYLNEETEAAVTIGSILKLASFIKGAAGDRITVDELCELFRLGGKTRRVFINLLTKLEEHLLCLRSNPSPRSLYRFFRDMNGGPELVLFATAHHLLPEETCSRSISYFFFQYSHQEELLSGAEIMKTYHLNEGEEVGAAIELLKVGERAGEVTTKDEAIAFLGRKLLTKNES